MQCITITSYFYYEPPTATLYQPTVEMKLAIAVTTLLFSGAVAFAPSTPAFSGRCIASSAATAKPTPTLFAGPEDEEGGLDLDLEEMFDM